LSVRECGLVEENNSISVYQTHFLGSKYLKSALATAGELTALPRPRGWIRVTYTSKVRREEGRWEGRRTCGGNCIRQWKGIALAGPERWYNLCSTSRLGISIHRRCGSSGGWGHEDVVNHLSLHSTCRYSTVYHITVTSPIVSEFGHSLTAKAPRSTTLDKRSQSFCAKISVNWNWFHVNLKQSLFSGTTL